MVPVQICLKFTTSKYLKIIIIALNHALIEKRLEWAYSSHSESGQRHHFYTWLGTRAPSAIFTRLFPFWLPHAFIDLERTLHETFNNYRDVEKMAWWLNHLKRCAVFLGEHPQVATEIGKMCNYRDGAYFK